MLFPNTSPQHRRRPPRHRLTVLAALTVLTIATVAVWWWHDRPRVPAAPTEPSAPPATRTEPIAPIASAPVIRYPIEGADGQARASQPSDMTTALTALFGRDAVLSLFELDNFPLRFATTVDNLGRSYAGARLWPVHPAGGRLIVGSSDGADVIGADNGLRYAPYVLVLEAVDPRQAVALYTRFYPSFQHAYEELGYPHAYFNDRLVAVIDLLLATPDRSGPLRVHLPSIAGPVQPARPWVLYEFDDPELQTLTAGQKLLLRMGPVNERRVKARLIEFRRLLTAKAAHH
jgi:hypothetical protein